MKKQKSAFEIYTFRKTSHVFWKSVYHTSKNNSEFNDKEVKLITKIFNSFFTILSENTSIENKAILNRYKKELKINLFDNIYYQLSRYGDLVRDNRIKFIKLEADRLFFHADLIISLMFMPGGYKELQDQTIILSKKNRTYPLDLLKKMKQIDEAYKKKTQRKSQLICLLEANKIGNWINEEKIIDGKGKFTRYAKSIRDSYKAQKKKL